MKVLVLGASGATGRHLVNQLLLCELSAKIVVRSLESLPNSWHDEDKLTIIVASILTLTNKDLQELVTDCQAITSCLGHNPTFNGVFGHPKLLVTTVTQRLCEAVNVSQPKNPIKFVLMNTAGNRIKVLKEQVSVWEKLIVGIIRMVLPPHVDNEKASAYLFQHIAHNRYIDWCIVRPDRLTNDNKLTPYKVQPSPIRSAIFNAGETSRINVAHFMATLVDNDNLWSNWKGQFPVIYNDSVKALR